MSEKRVVGIRGLDLQIYEQIQELARRKGDNVANIINDALKKYLSSSNDVDYTAPQTISGQSKFEITAEALHELSPLRIEDVATVIVVDDTNQITSDMINQDLESIIRSQEIYVPDRLYYVILKKAKNVNNVIKYTGPWKEETTLNFGANAKLNAKMLQKFKQENKRLKIIVTGGDLLIENDISVDMFEEMISELKVKGNLIVPEALYASVLTKGTIEGSVQLTDKEGKIFDQIQFGNVTKPEESEQKGSKRTAKGKSSPFTFTFNPGMDTLIDSIEEIKEGIAKTLKNLNIEADFSEAINNEIDKEIKRKQRVKPTKVKSFKGSNSNEKDKDNDDDDEDDYKIDIE